jgi:hypothetical protein
VRHAGGIDVLRWQASTLLDVLGARPQDFRALVLEPFLTRFTGILNSLPSGSRSALRRRVLPH